MASDPKRIKHVLEAVTDDIDKLNEWEQSFIRNIEETFRKRGELSDGQYDKLEAIYEERCQ